MDQFGQSARFPSTPFLFVNDSGKLLDCLLHRFCVPSYFVE
jgi:hypothetical protein